MVPIDAGDEVAVGLWLATVQYREIHAFVWGVGLGGGATIGTQVAPATAATLASVALAILLWAFTGYAAVVAEKRRSKKSGSTGPGIPHRVVLKQVYREPHYYIAGLVIGAGAGGVAVALVTVLGG